MRTMFVHKSGRGHRWEWKGAVLSGTALNTRLQFGQDRNRIRVYSDKEEALLGRYRNGKGIWIERESGERERK